VTPYEIAIHRGQVAEHLAEARHLAERFPGLFGAIIAGKRKVGYKFAEHDPVRADYPAVPGWGRLPLIAAISTGSFTCLYGGAGAGLLDYRRLAGSIARPSSSGTSSGGPREAEALTVLAPEHLTFVMAIIGLNGVPGLALAADESRADHPGWDGPCRVIVLRHGLFRSTTYQLSATLAGLDLGPVPADGTDDAILAPDRGEVALPAGPIARPSGEVPKAPSPEAFQCYRIKCITGTERTQASIANEVHGDPRFQSKVSRDLRRVQAWIAAGNVLPDMDGAKPRIHSVDPARLDMGRRRDDGRRADD